MKLNKNYKLYNDDCRNVLPQIIEDGVEVDLTITSPPYSEMRTYDGTNKWDWDTFTQIVEQLYSITKQGGVVVWIVADQTVDGDESGLSFKQALYFKEIGFKLHDTMIYRKKGLTFPDSNRYFGCFEYMFVFSKGKPKTVHLIHDRKNLNAGNMISSTGRQQDGKLVLQNGAKKKRRIKEKGRRYNIWEYGTGYGQSSHDPLAFEHPAIFPEKLAEDHIRSWSNEDDIVLDCMMGSGTTGVMSIRNNRRFIGIERVEKYYNIARERIKKESQQTRLI